MRRRRALEGWLGPLWHTRTQQTGHTQSVAKKKEGIDIRLGERTSSWDQTSTGSHRQAQRKIMINWLPSLFFNYFDMTFLYHMSVVVMSYFSHVLASSGNPIPWRVVKEREREREGFGESKWRHDDTHMRRQQYQSSERDWCMLTRVK